MTNIPSTAANAPQSGSDEIRAEMRRWLAFFAVAATGFLAYWALAKMGTSNGFAGELVGQFDFRILKPLRDTLFFWLLSAEFIGVFLAVLVLQFTAPARPEHRFFSGYVLTDLSWYFYASIFMTFTMAVVVGWTVTALEPYFAPYRFTALAAMPLPLRFLVALVIVEFLHWFQHFASHKIPFLWQFHAVHHSQPEINFFTVDRGHFLEYPYRLTIAVTIVALFGIDIPLIFGFAAFNAWHARIVHVNLKLNFGPLRYIFVTPQSHRYHHIPDPELRDKNYARYLTLWDWVFGTQATAWDDYPENGILDPHFPLESSRPSIQAVWMPLVQQAYSFKTAYALVADCARKRSFQSG